MEFYEVINKRRSIRQFEDKGIPREILERILEAGLKAPSSNHQRRWELVTLTEKAVIMELAKFIRPYPCRIQEPKTPQQEMFQIAYPRQRSMIEESACVILPYFKQKYTFDNDKNGYGLMEYGAAWALIENMLLAATELELGSCWIHTASVQYFKTLQGKEHKRMWGLERYECLESCVIGYAAQDPLQKEKQENIVRFI